MLQILVSPIAKWRIARVFACTQRYNFITLSCKRHRLKGCSLMRTVAERLLGAAPAGAPEVRLILLHRNHNRCLLANPRFIHLFPLPLLTIPYRQRLSDAQIKRIHIKSISSARRIHSGSPMDDILTQHNCLCYLVVWPNVRK